MLRSRIKKLSWLFLLVLNSSSNIFSVDEGNGGTSNDGSRSSEWSMTASRTESASSTWFFTIVSFHMLYTNVRPKMAYRKFVGKNCPRSNMGLFKHTTIHRGRRQRFWKYFLDIFKTRIKCRAKTWIFRWCLAWPCQRHPSRLDFLQNWETTLDEILFQIKI